MRHTPGCQTGTPGQHNAGDHDHLQMSRALGPPKRTTPMPRRAGGRSDCNDCVIEVQVEFAELDCNERQRKRVRPSHCASQNRCAGICILTHLMGQRSLHELGLFEIDFAGEFVSQGDQDVRMLC
jgi:hypothetical protein